MKKLYKKVVLFILESKPYNYFAQFVLPKIFLRKKKQLDVDKVLNEISDSLLKYLNQSILTTRGVFILSRDPSKLAGKIIPGDIDHAGVLDRGYVIEAKADGVVRTSLSEFIEESEGIVIVAGVHWDKNYRNDIANKANSFIGREYDRKFKFGTKALYCSEVCYCSDFKHPENYDLSDLVNIGRPYISPEGIASALGMVRIYDSRCFNGND